MSLSVKAERGWVTLTGEVPWHYQRVAAESGVRKISDVKHKIEEALKRNAEIEAQGIRVTVTDTSVRLEGKVNAWHERDVVEKAAWSVPGVQNVVDKLSI